MSLITTLLESIMNRYLFIIILSALSFNLTAQTIKSNHNNEGISFEELLKTSKPAPNPPGRHYSQSESADENQRLPVEYDIDSKNETISQFLPKINSTDVDYPQLGQVPANFVWPDEDFSEPPMPKMINPTEPTQQLNTTQNPWNTIYKLVMKFTVDGEDYFSSCSAWSAGNFHLVTAGHCIYNFDPNDDGDESDQKWADEVWAIPAQTDRVSPTNCGTAYCGDRPYGWARAVNLRSYTGWTVGHNHEHDWGVITLDRNMGQRTGWMGRSSTVNESLNFSGYPTQTPYVPEGVAVQYKGFDSGNVYEVTDYRIELDAFIYGGHSGGPSWRYSDGNRYVVGIHSTSNRTGIATDTLLTSGKRSDINTWIAADTVNIPPSDKVDVTEYLFDGNSHKTISKTTVGKGEVLTLDYSLLNAGFAELTNDIVVFVMASWNETISTNDTLIGSDLHSDNINPYTFKSFSTDITVPNTLPAGEYTVGLLMSVAGEYDNELLCDGTPCSNTISFADQILTVEDCNSDDYEDDNEYVSATNLVTGITQTHTLCATSDKDWFKFIVPTGGNSEVILETSGPSGDTVIKLYNSSLALIELDDQGGVGNFSKIERTCESDSLSPGTYYLEVEEYQNNNIIDEYQINGSIVQCNDLIFKNGFSN